MPTTLRPSARLALLALALLVLATLAVPALTGAGPALAQDDPAGPDGDPTGEPVTPGNPDGDPDGEPVTPGDPGPTSRLAGPPRIDTAVAISQRAFPSGAATAYLANADVTVDAVAGGSLTDGPVLLVPTCTLPDQVATELTRLAPGEVIALGGAAAVCDDVLADAAAAAAAGGPGGEPGDRPDHIVTAEAELVDASATPPFTVAVTDPGILFEGGTFDHQVTFTGTDGDVVLDDPRFSGVLTEGDGQLVITGRGCGPTLSEDEVQIACTDDLQLVEVADGEDTTTDLTLHTADESVGDTPVADGTYVLDQPVRWSVGTAADDPSFDDGQVTVRITYTVTTPDGPDTPDDPAEEPGTEVVEWATPEGSFRTTGHSDFDLARIAEGVEAGEHIGIPNGVIRRGDGGVNTGHDWHLVEIELVDQTIEVCDGTADYVDAHLEDYLAIGRYCPWGAVPTSITP